MSKQGPHSHKWFSQVLNEMRRIFILEYQEIVNLWITTIDIQHTFDERST